jgi:hypothetical protein
MAARSSSLSIFCTLSELAAWLSQIMQEEDFIALRFPRDGDLSVAVAPQAELGLDGNTLRVFLLPADTAPPHSLHWNDVRPREWSWVDIAPGGTARSGEQCLLLTAIAFEKADGSPAAERAAKAFRKLRKLVQAEATAGVLGRNVVTGGEATYRDIWHSRGAREALESGVSWKQQATGNAVFVPAKP